MFSRQILALIFAFSLSILSGSCSNQRRREINHRLISEMPHTILWAWERPEDLRFLDTEKFGVAYLAQTLYLENDEVVFRPRRQSLEISPATYLIAVTRIETNKNRAERPTLSDSQKDSVVRLIKASLERPNVRAVQIDFDVKVSEREFYKRVVNQIKKDLPADVPLSITSLASWCVADSWFDDFPVDEAVPMAFRMGADSDRVREYLISGNDWREPLCLGSYGFSVDEPLKFERKPDRRVYYFNSKSWTKSDLDLLNQ